MKSIFDYKFRFYTSKMNEICLHCHLLYFSSIILIQFQTMCWKKNQSWSFQLYILLWAELSNCFLSFFSLFSNAYSISSCDNFCFAATVENKNHYQWTLKCEIWAMEIWNFVLLKEFYCQLKIFQPEKLKNCHHCLN